jgi:protein-tyrosine phosphatase
VTGGSVAVDLHCHILPGLDDGARDLADAVAMAEQAQADGIEAICATPHIRHDHDVSLHELPDRLAELSEAIRAAGCGIRVLPGGEVAVTTLEELDDPDLACLSLGGSRRWILLEPPPGPLDDRLERATEELHARGFRALVAHPERHLAPDWRERLRRLVDRGALAQATAASLLDDATRPTMLTLARTGLVHVLGSDAHSSRFGRPVALAAAVRTLCTSEPLVGHLEWIAETAPWAIVRGRELIAPYPPTP